MTPEGTGAGTVGRLSRRQVVAGGVKLAYVAPVVAASFHLARDGALAVSPDSCTIPFVCDLVESDCVPGECQCLQPVEGGVVHCGNDFFCDDSVACVSTAQCVGQFGAGFFCQHFRAGCCGQVCVPPCGRGFPTAAGAGATNRGY
jgi:hypothetical protein